METTKRLIVACVGLALAGLFASPLLYSDHRDVRVKYPQNYRQWTRVRSMVIQEGHPLYASFGGIHHIYANSMALEGMKREGAYPNGSVFVFELLDAKTEPNAILEGEQRRIGVMEKNRHLFPDTGGWGFEAFDSDSGTRQVAGKLEEKCFDCHRTQARNDYVFGSRKNS